MKTKLLLFFIFCGFLSFGQVNIPNATPVIQNFDTELGSIGNATLPAGFVTNTSTNYSTGVTATTLAYGTSGTGAVTGTSGGGIINWGNGVTATATDRCLGFLNSGSYLTPNSIILQIRNSGTTNITDLQISFDYEKYRTGTRAFNWTFTHGNVATSVTISSTTGDQSYAADAGNAVVNPPTTINKTVTIGGLNIAPNSFYYLCWTSTGVGGSTNGQGIGIDNLSLTALFEVSCTPPADPTGTISGTTPACTSTSLSYSGTATAPIVNYWQTTPTGTSTANSAASNLSVLTSGNYYVRAFNSSTSCWSTGSIGPYAVTINPVQNITTQPTNSSIVAGANTSFSVVASNATSYQWQVDMGLGFNNVTNVAPYSNATTATLNITNTPLSFNNYMYRCVLTNATCADLNSNSVTLLVTAPTPTTTISTTALSGFNYAQGFGPSANQSFTISGTNLTSNITVSANTNYEIATVAGGTYVASLSFIPTSGTVATTSVFARLKASLVVGSYNEVISISSTNATNKTVNLAGTVTNSNTSDITENISFTYPIDIPYANFQNPTITNTANSIGVFQFTIRDGGATLNDSDILGTELNAITFNVANIANIRSAALFAGNAQLNNAPTIGANTISFSGLSGTNFTASDNSSLTLTLRLTFNSVVTDNQQMQFTIASANSNPALSTFGTANAGGAISNITGDRNRIEVTADRLVFVQQPTTTTVVSVMTPSPTVQAVDVLLNRDLDFTTATTVTSTGILTGSPIGGSISAGLITFTGLAHTVAGTNLQLTATTTGLTFSNFVNSSNFDITDVANGTYRTTSNGTWPTSGTATWERLNSGSWTTATPAANTTDLLLIRHTISTNAAFAATGGTKMKIENNGIFNAGHNSTFNSILIETGGKITINNPGVVVTTNGTITAESGANVTINSGTLNLVDGFWNGIENFKSGSILEIQNWDWNDLVANERLIGSANLISTNSNGYYFGNILFNANPSAKSFTIVGITGNFKLCENDLTINNASTTNNVILTNVNANVEIGGNLVVNSNKFSFGAVGSSNLAHVVKGNIVLNAGGILDLNQQSAGAASVFVNLEGNLATLVGSTVNSTDAGCKIVFNKSGLQTCSIAGNMGTQIAFEVSANSTTRLINQNLNLANPSNRFSVLTNGILEFNYLDFVGSGDFIQETLGVLKITSADGVNVSGNNTGNLRNTGTRTFSQTGHFYFVGNVTPQNTGTAMTNSSTAKLIVVDKLNSNDIVNLTQSTGTTNELNLIRGNFIETEASNIFGSGNLSMQTNTKYTSSVTSANFPKLSGTYNLFENSTIELNAFANQVLKGSNDYRNLTFSNAGTKTITSTTNSVIGTILIANAAILDIDNKSLGGSSTNLTMTGTSEFRMAGTGVKPDASGIYTLGTNSKISFTNGSFANPVTTLQSIRLSPSYANMDIVGNNVGTNTTTGSIQFQNGANFRIAPTGIFRLSNTAGFSGVAQAAISNLITPIITLQPNSTIEYNGDNQTITNFNPPRYTNLKISGNGIKTLGNATQTFVNENLNVDSSKLLLNANEILTVRNSVNINDAAGEMELKNNAQLIQIDESSTNSGTNFKLERIATVTNLDYVYWSSPVENFNVSNIPDNFRYFWNPQFSNPNASVGNWNAAAGVMEKGQGYIVRSSTGPNLTTNFLGKPNNGTFTKTIIRGDLDDSMIPVPVGLGFTAADDNWNLLGNPYPSAMSADKFLLKNADGANPKIEGSIWIWKHGIQPSSAIENPYYSNFSANYSSTDYIKYNLLGPTPPEFAGFIASGQGFMVSMLHTAGTTSPAIPNTGNTTQITEFRSDVVTFENSMRSNDINFDPYSNSQFFKESGKKESQTNLVNEEEKHRIWLDLTKESVNETETMLLGYTTNATLNRDRLYDCFYTPKSEIAIYSLIENSGFIIQGRPLPFDFNDQIPLGINIANAGNHKIGIRQVDGLFTNNQTIYLQDLYLNTIHDLSANPYSFTTTTGKFNDRFVLRYTNGILGITSNVLEENIIVFAKNNSITVVSQSDTIESIEVLSILGKQIAKQINVNSMQFVLDNILATKQTLLVKIKLVNGVEKIQKVIL